MKGIIQLLLAVVVVLHISGCASEPVDDSGDLGDDIETSDSASDDTGDSGGDDLAVEADSTDDTEPADTADAAADETEQQMVESDQNQKAETAEVAPEKEDKQTNDEFFNGEKSATVAEEAAPTEAPATEAPPADAVPAQVEPPPPTVETPAPESSSLAHVTNIKFEANDAGGSVVIEGDAPLSYKTRMNDGKNQFVVEVENAKLASDLKRTFNTKDFSGAVGSIDAYQDPGASSAFVVVQLREGVQPPTVQAEGNSLIVISGGGSGSENPVAQEQFTEGQGLLSYESLGEFLAGNMKFYGKKISIEAKSLDIRDAISLIAEESGTNLILSEGVTGEVNLKLRQVPWDQALVMLMKTKRLGYTRNGNVLRIAPISEIREEEENALRLAESKRKVDPMVVQVIPVSFAKVDELKTQILAFLSERGKVVGDPRTSSIIVTDTAEVVERVKKLVSGLDTAPPQVLIEGKIVEARETFEKRTGIQWSVAGTPVNMGSGSNGPVNLNPSVAVRPGISTGNALGLNLSIGTLDVLGDINAVLSLQERQDNVRVISSPRIVTLHNEPAEITQQGEVVFIKSSVQDGVVTRSPEFKPISLKLSVLPQVTNDSSVIMNVDVKRDFVGPAVDEQSQAAPVNSRNAKTRVMVKNGQTAVIGGIYQSDDLNSENGVPGLKDIPVLGWLFKSRNEIKDKTELLIFLTPRILEAEAPSSSGGDVTE